MEVGVALQLLCDMHGTGLRAKHPKVSVCEKRPIKNAEVVLCVVQQRRSQLVDVGV